MTRYLLFALMPALVAVVDAQEKITFQDHVRPVLENRCNNCHNPDKKKGDLDLSTYAGVIAGGAGGAAVEAGEAAGSTLWKVISHLAEPAMPPKGDKLPQAEIDLIGKWIAGGLLDSPDSTVKVKKKEAFTMTAAPSAKRPEGPPPLPGALRLDPVVTPARPNAVLALAHSPWAPLVAMAAPRQVLLYHSGTADLLGVLPFPDGGTPECLSFSRNGALLLAGGGIPGKQGLVVVWDIKSGLPVIQLAMNEDYDTVLAADLSADLTRVAMGGPGRRVRIYDTRTSQLLVNIKKHTDWVTALAFSPDGVLLASGDRNGGLFVWEAAGGNEFQSLRQHEKMIACLAWRGDSNLLAAGSEDGTFTWWEMANGTQVKKIASHGGVLALGFAPDGRLVSGGRDGHARIWDGNGKAVRDWVPAGGSAVLETVFSEDGTRILTGSWNGEVRSWEAGKAEAEPVILVANPPSLEARLAALEKSLTERRAAVAAAEAALVEKQTAATTAESGLAAHGALAPGLTEKVKAATAIQDALSAGIAGLETRAAGFTEALAAVEKSLTVPPAAVSAPSGTASPPEVAGALEAAAAEAALEQISRNPLTQKAAALRQSLAACQTALTQQRTEHGAAVRAAAAAKQEQEAWAGKTKALQQQVAAAQAEKAKAGTARGAALATLAAGTRELARWQAGRVPVLDQSAR